MCICRCNHDSQCCQTLESCVSCCLAPQHNASTIYNKDYRSPGRSAQMALARDQSLQYPFQQIVISGLCSWCSSHAVGMAWVLSCIPIFWPFNKDKFANAKCRAGQCRMETGKWGSPFEFCRGKCRTSSKSTVHENAYLDSYHHCFSQSGKTCMHTAHCM